MNDIHSIIVAFLTVMIVGFQFRVFLLLRRQIRLFKNIFPNVNGFETIKVRIPLDQITIIKPEEILNNRDQFMDTDHVWMKKENESLKVSSELVELYEEDGWRRIE